MKYILNFEEMSLTLPSVGGKNANLGEMIRAGVPVPPGFALTTDCYLDFITQTGIKGKILRLLSAINLDDRKSLDELSSELQALIRGAPIPEDVQEAIKEGYSYLCKQCCADKIPVAVRSSATAEDLPTASFAGQHETYLWVEGADRVIQSVHRCWASLFTPRAISYRIKNNFPHEKVLMSVGVQRMVNSRVAGVMFTLNPLNGDPSKIVIEASWGLGEAVVSGSVTPDKFVVDKVVLDILERSIGSKTEEYTLDKATRRVVKHKTDKKRQDVQCLSDEEIINLARMGKAIEHHYRQPQDIEWAFEEDLKSPENLFILQARQETVWSVRKADPIRTESSYMSYLVNRIIEGW
jgi:pyruvate,water dikinase